MSPCADHVRRVETYVHAEPGTPNKLVVGKAERKSTVCDVSSAIETILNCVGLPTFPAAPRHATLHGKSNAPLPALPAPSGLSAR